MTQHRAMVQWSRTSDDFSYESYNRSHQLSFKGGAIVLAGGALPEFNGDGHGVDPEELFVGSLSACHMLTFLAIASRQKLTVNAYEDDAVGLLEREAWRTMWVTRVILKPLVRFKDDVTDAKVNELHAMAHNNCFMVNSVKIEVLLEPRLL